jgi:hypothetical protein
LFAVALGAFGGVDLLPRGDLLVLRRRCAVPVTVAAAAAGCGEQRERYAGGREA